MAEHSHAALALASHITGALCSAIEGSQAWNSASVMARCSAELHVPVGSVPLRGDVSSTTTVGTQSREAGTRQAKPDPFGSPYTGTSLKTGRVDQTFTNACQC